tara:strand:- start:176 stop:454 length:279 start_codon:yes stop_codon:yes gene_type:complete
MNMVNKILILSFIICIILLIFIIGTNNNIKDADACLCTEILSNETFLNNVNKMPSVKNCMNKFNDFDSAHLKCIKSLNFDNPEIKMDSLKST